VLLRLDHSWKYGLWIILLILTFTLMFYPICLSDQYQLYEPINVFPNLGLFVSLYYAWMPLLMLLLLTSSTSGMISAEMAVLVIMFSLVFWGIWPLATPYGQNEELLFLRHVKSIEQSGRIIMGDPTLTYNDWPGLLLLATFTLNISGLSRISVRTVVMLLNAFLIPFMLFLSYRRLPRIEMYIASLAVVLLVESNPHLSISFFFRPENALGILLFLAIFFLLSRSRDVFPASRREIVMSLTLFLALVATHFISSLIFLVVLTTIYLLYKRTETNIVRFSFVLVAILIVMAWVLYKCFFGFNIVTEILKASIRTTFVEKKTFFYLFSLTSANLGEQVPWWARATRTFWLVFVYIGGGVLAILNLVRFRKLSSNERLYTSVCLAIILSAVALSLAETRGTQVVRYIEFGGFFLAPTILLFLRRLRRYRGVVVLFLAGLLVAFSFPSFLVYHSRISQSTYYSSDFTALDYVSSFHSEPWNATSLYVGGRESYFYFYYVPEANVIVRSTWEVEVGGSQFHWKLLTEFVDSFMKERYLSRTFVILQFSRNWMTGEMHGGLFPPGHPKWKEFMELIDIADKIYDSGIVQFHA